VDVDLRSDEPHGGTPTPPRPRRITQGLRWVFWRHLPFGGLAGALVFFCASLTPSLLPRGVLLQGVVTGVTALIGYGFGSMFSSWIRKAISREPRPDTKRAAWWILVGATIILVPLFLYLGGQWQETTRKLMGMELLESYEWLAMLVIAVIVFGLFLFVSRIVRGGARGLIRLIDRWMPRLVAQIAGVVLATFIVIGFVQGFLFDGIVSALNSTYSLADGGTSAGITRPKSSLRSGGPGSLVPWDTLGVKGRDFAGEGWAPTVDDISEFTGQPATEPIRTYIGLESAETVEERVDLAVRELERTNAFTREVLVIVTTTGTGWVDANVSNGIEYMYGGDTAIVGLQYSYLPSWISFLVDRSKAAEAGRAMITGVTERWNQFPPDERAKLLVFGESLGSYGTENAFDGLDDWTASVDGALLEGPTFANPLRNEFTDGRDAGSTEWLPIYDGGRATRFATKGDDFEVPTAEWSTPHIAYLQNATDPISFFSLDLLWKKPDWLDDPRGPDVTPEMIWFPTVTFWQVAADLAFSTGVPDGHGHSYGANVADGWVAIAAPPGWTDADTERLKETLNEDIEHIDELKAQAASAAGS
jgi:uncharacterized membrane protein